MMFTMKVDRISQEDGFVRVHLKGPELTLNVSTDYKDLIEALSLFGEEVMVEIMPDHLK